VKRHNQTVNTSEEKTHKLNLNNKSVVHITQR